MGHLNKFGIPKGEGKYPQEIIYTTALVYNLASQRMSEYLNDYGLSLGKLNILVAVKHQGGPKGLPQVKLSEHLIVTPSNMTKMIDKLEKEGLVTRSSLAGDRRVNIIQITTKADKLLDQLWGGFQLKMDELVKTLSVSKQKQLAGLLSEWSEKMLE